VTTLLERMGLQPGAAWRSTAFEVGVPVLAGFALGAVFAPIVTGIVLDPLDAEPGATVGAVRTVPVDVLLGLAAGTLAAVAFASHVALVATRRRTAGVVTNG
jgi:hypothetical protein